MEARWLWHELVDSKAEIDNAPYWKRFRESAEKQKPIRISPEIAGEIWQKVCEEWPSLSLIEDSIPDLKTLHNMFLGN